MRGTVCTRVSVVSLAHGGRFTGARLGGREGRGPGHPASGGGAAPFLRCLGTPPVVAVPARPALLSVGAPELRPPPGGSTLAHPPLPPALLQFSPSLSPPGHLATNYSFLRYSVSSFCLFLLFNSYFLPFLNLFPSF